MQIQPASVTSFPILVETLECEMASSLDEWIAPTDIYRLTYHQGQTVTEDQIDSTSWKRVARRKNVRERNPVYAAPGKPAYLKGGWGKAALMLGGRRQPLIEGPVHQASFSSDGQMAFVQNSGLWLARADGSQARRLDVPCPVRSIEDLKFSPDGRNLWYCSDGTLHQSDPVLLTHQTVPTDHPVTEFALSPDGKSLAYLDGASLFRRDLEVGREACLTEGSEAELGEMSSPTFTPDGSRVLFTVAETSPGENYGDDFDAHYEPWTDVYLWVVSRQGGDAVEVGGDTARIRRVTTEPSRR